MFAEFKHTIGRMRGAIIGWGIGLALYGWMLTAFYDTMAQAEGLQELLSSYPKEMMAFLGDVTALNTPAGYVDTYYSVYMSLIIGIFAIGTGASLLVGDEERGILDLVLAHPLSRTALFWGRVLGFAVVTAAILLIAWLGWAIPARNTTMGLSWIQYLQPFLPLFAVLFWFAMLALLLSLVLPSAGMAGMLSGALLVANFLLVGLVRINPDLETFVKWTPLRFYQGGYAVHGIHWTWLAALLVPAVLFAVLAVLFFQRREIRVGGEHGWRVPTVRLPWRRAKAGTGA